MITCDLCGKAKDCEPREIEGKEYDVCAQCWDPLAQKLKGKGRKKYRAAVLLPPRPISEHEEKKPEPLPGEPPVIQGVVAVL